MVDRPAPGEHQAERACGIIPARAGSRLARSRHRRPARDHPRACGEQRLISVAVLSLSGSSPRVRGAGRARPIAVREDGIIPARAGSRVSILFQNSRHRDHPRACGEQGPNLDDAEVVEGSSPRVRGAVLCRAGSPAGPGIIPARAGSSCGGFSRLWASRDHPRACGEQAIAAGPRAGYAGSSPRVRGAEAQPHARSDALGIIPARAGSSAHCRCGGQAARDHPRACGEQLRRKVDDFCDVGSSPRVRGAVLRRLDDIARLGIIPARAGSRTFMQSPTSCSRDHPRACGEQWRLFLTL